MALVSHGRTDMEQSSNPHTEIPETHRGLARPSFADCAYTLCRRAGEAGWDVIIYTGLRAQLEERPGTRQTDPPNLACWQGILIRYGDWLISRDKLTPWTLLEGARYRLDDSNGASACTLILRTPDVEEAGVIAEQILRGARGTSMRRRTATAIANTMAALAERATQRLPR